MKPFLLFLFSLLAFPLAVVSATGRYAVTMDMGKASLTGIMLVRQDDKNIKGSMVNEFGVSAMDFVYCETRDKLKFCHIVSFMDKWYIKRVLRQDLRFCLSILYNKEYARKHYYTVEYVGDEVRIANTRHGITYTFAPLIQEDTDDTEG
ncbi:MAG: hypothetical protein NC113_08900 [Bacteroides sp.]|nr:hypothetical protein [Bacteroides sp.]MCM1448313.1 hypothetical protein [Bacteroides sp.]